MYHLFFKTKLSQETSYFEEKNKAEQKNSNIQNNEVYNDVYINAKLALN